MVKKSRGGRMAVAKRRAADGSGGKGMVKNRPAGKNISSSPVIIMVVDREDTAAVLQIAAQTGTLVTSTYQANA